MESYTTDWIPAIFHTTTNTSTNRATSPSRANTTRRNEYRQSTDNSSKACHRHTGRRSRSKESKNRDTKETKGWTTTAKHSYGINISTLYSNEVGNITNANRFTNQTDGRPSTWRKCKQEQKARYNTTSTCKTRRDKGKRQYKTKTENQRSYSCIAEWQEDTTATCEDPPEVRAEQRLPEPHIYNNEGFDTEKLKQGMQTEMEPMKTQGVYEEIDVTKLTPQQRQELDLDNIIESRWVYRSKVDEVRARMVAKGYTEHIEDQDDVYASTPLFAVLRVLLAPSMAREWLVQVGDTSTAFLHALAATAGLVLRPPKEYCTNPYILWKLHKAMYGLRSSPKAWQEHLSKALTDLGLKRLQGKVYIMVYVDDLLFTGEPGEVARIFKEIQAKMLLRATNKTIDFLGRKITNKGNHFEVSLRNSYIENILQEANLQKATAAVTTGSNSTTPTTEQDELLDTEEHAYYRRMIGKLQWLSYTRPGMSFAGKELARSLQQPTVRDTLPQVTSRYTAPQVRDTANSVSTFRQQGTAQHDTLGNSRAGCQVTRKSTSGFVFQFLGTTVHFGSRTQSVVALSSAESEFYAIGTGATEALHLKNFLGEILHNKISLKMHTDSTSGKSMATRSGVSKRAKHIELKYMFTVHTTPHSRRHSVHTQNQHQNTTQQIYLQNTCKEKCCNGTCMLRAYVRQTTEENPATAVSDTSSIRTQQVHTYLQHIWLSISCTRLSTLRVMVIIVQFVTYMITSFLTTSLSPRATWSLFVSALFAVQVYGDTLFCQRCPIFRYKPRCPR